MTDCDKNECKYIDYVRTNLISNRRQSSYIQLLQVLFEFIGKALQYTHIYIYITQTTDIRKTHSQTV